MTICEHSAGVVTTRRFAIFSAGARVESTVTSAGNKAYSEPRTAGRLAAVVVTHNRKEKLGVTLRRLMSEPADLLHAIVVVDNNSSDGTGALLAELKDASNGRIHVHHSDVNLGGAGGFEIGMRLAVERFAPDWLVVMDDDARPMPGAIAAFQSGDHGGWDGVAAAVYFPTGEICEMNRPSRNPFWSVGGFARLVAHVVTGRGRDGFHIPRSSYECTVPTPIDATSFVGFFVSRRGIDLAGYPDARLFIYGDDVLYTLGLRDKGGSICFDPNIRFEHDFTTIGTGERRFSPLWKSYYHHRNLLIVYRRSAGWLFWPALLVVLPKWLLKVTHHKGERQPYLRLLSRAISDGLREDLGASLADIQRLAGQA